MRVEAIIFDFEGTLVGFAWEVEEAVREVKNLLKSESISAPSDNYAEIYNFVASNYPELISKVDDIYDKYDKKAFSEWILKSDVVEVLRSLRTKKAVLSNIGKSVLVKALKKFGIYEMFDAVVGRGDVKLLKPSPLGIFRLIEILNVDRNSVLFVGDSKSDVKACRAAGVRIAVVEGENKFSELEADYRLKSLSDILSLPIQGL